MDHPGKWPPHLLTPQPLYCLSKISKEHAVRCSFFCCTTTAFKEREASSWKLADTMQTWQWQMICLTELSCRFSHFYSTRGFLPRQHCSGRHISFSQLVFRPASHFAVVLCRAETDKHLFHLTLICQCLWYRKANSNESKKYVVYIPTNWTFFSWLFMSMRGTRWFGRFQNIVVISTLITSLKVASTKA